jgi:hypothetical protein
LPGHFMLIFLSFALFILWAHTHILFVLLSCFVRIQNIVEDLVWITLVWSCVLSIFVYFEERHHIHLLLLFSLLDLCMHIDISYEWMKKKINWHHFWSFQIFFSSSILFHVR